MSTDMEANPAERVDEPPTTVGEPRADRAPMAGAPVVERMVVPGTGLALFAGLLITLLGAWGALVAYLGPTFGFGPAGAAAWQWSGAHTYLNLVPGAAAVAAGMLMMLGSAARGRAPLLGLAALVAFGAGAWFVLGPQVYPILVPGATVPSFGALTGAGGVAHFVTRVGYGMGEGLLMCLLAGMVMAVASFRPMVAGRGVARRDAALAGRRRHRMAH
ncbi:MAG TPA: hypothetical protein VE990_09180 [Acidimicrobiales bacterium]|nr:hypothetical protein [Acidimicrobiales bacterium]